MIYLFEHVEFLIGGGMYPWAAEIEMTQVTKPYLSATVDCVILSHMLLISVIVCI